MKSSAMFSECGLYRYELRREWDPRLPPFIVIMLNPSTADQFRKDPTIARMIKRAATRGYGSVIVGNVGAGRATHPRDWLEMDDPIGPENKRALRRVMREAHDRGGTVMVGWGNHAPAALACNVVRAARHIGVKLWCLGVTKSGAPLHPLHVAYSRKMVRYYGSQCDEEG